MFRFVKVGLIKKINKEKEEILVKLYQDGASAPKIAEQLGVSHSLILRYLERNNIERRSAEEAHRIYQINEDFFDQIDSEEKAYFLGMLYADGHVHSDTGNHYIRLELASKDKDILYKLSKLIFIDNPDDHVVEYTRERNLTGEDKTYYSHYLTIHSKHMCAKLITLGCTPNKSLTLEWPEWLVDNTLQRHFIRGYYDGDGGVSLTDVKTRGTHSKMISTLNFTQNIDKIINEAVETHFSFYNDVEDKDVYSIRTSGNRQVLKLFDWLYKDATIWMNRKYDLYQELLTKIEETDELIRAGTQGYQKRYLDR